MQKKPKIKYIITCILVAVIFFFIGYKAADSRKEDTQCFYATITEINGNVFTVHGLDINNINFQGDFTFLIKDNTELEYNYESLEVTDFSIGNTLCVTFQGSVEETDPAQINVIKLEQLKHK